jgi:hypothetical protein
MEGTHLTRHVRPGHSPRGVLHRNYSPPARTKGGTKGDGQRPTQQSPTNSKGDGYSTNAECK